jgi:hypothetical protein
VVGRSEVRVSAQGDILGQGELVVRMRAVNHGAGNDDELTRPNFRDRVKKVPAPMDSAGEGRLAVPFCCWW